nr:MAG TPA: Baseplate wedge protein [Caudoviricetes sp.]
MRPQAYQTPEIRDENDSIIQQGTFGKKTPFVNSQNDGILDYIINNLEAIKGMSLAATIVVSSLPSAGQAGKFYLLDDGTENSGKVYIYKDKWIEVTTQAVGLSAYQIALNNGYEGTEQEWLENEVYGDDIVSAETDSDGYFIVHTRQGKTIKTALKPLVDAKASADKAKTSETNAKASETNSANSAAAALASQEASADSQTKAKTSETNAKTSELNAKTSENNAKSSENLAKAWAMSESSPDGVDGNKSAKTWAGEAKASASNSASSASASRSSATASASSASDAKVSETKAAASAAAAAQSAENAKLFDPSNYAKYNEIFSSTSTGRKTIEKEGLTDLNDIKCVSYPSWMCNFTTTAQKLSNCPVKVAFFLYNIRTEASSTDETLPNLTSRYYYVEQILIDLAGSVWLREGFNSKKETFTFGNWKKLTVTSDLPTKTSQLTNDSNFATMTELENGFTTASLTVSGETSVPTPSIENNSKTIANTEFVHGVVNKLVNGAPTALDTLQELATALGNDPNFATPILNKIGEKESKTDAQIEHEKLQNAIDACLESKANMGITPETNPQIIAIPLKKGMFPISGYPDGFTVTDRKYPYSLVVNLQGNGGTLLSLYAQHNRRELYFRVGWADERGWGTWVKLATTDDIDAIKPSLLTGNDALFNYLHRIGTNPTLPTTNQELTALGVFMSYYWHEVIAHQPTQYGQLINLPADSSNELAQFWIAQPSGQMYHRAGNTGTPINDVPFTRFLDEDDATKLEAKIPTKISKLTDDVGIAKISNGHLVINGSELWIE